MELNYSLLLPLLLGFFCFDLLLLMGIFLSKTVYRSAFKRRRYLEAKLIPQLLSLGRSGDFSLIITRQTKRFFNLFDSLSETVKLPEELHSKIISSLSEFGIEKKLIQRLSSPFLYTRIKASIRLSMLGTDEAVGPLIEQMRREKRWFAKVFTVNTLVELKAESSINAIILSLQGAPQWYREKVYSLLAEFGESMESFILEKINSEHERDAECVIDFASRYPSSLLLEYVKEFAFDKDPSNLVLTEKAVQALYAQYPKEVTDPYFLNHPSRNIRRVAVKALGYSPSEETLEKAYAALGDGEIDREAVETVSQIIMKRPELASQAENRFIREKNPKIKNSMALVLSGFLDYYLSNIISGKYSLVEDIINSLCEIGKVSNLIGFMNENKDPDIESTIVSIMEKKIREYPEIKEEMSLHLSENLRKALNLKMIEEQVDKKKLHITKFDKTLFFCLFLGAFLIVPVLYLLFSYSGEQVESFWFHLRDMMVQYHFFFAFYSVAINTLYLILLILAGINLSKQIRVWRFKETSFLFKKRILPSVSILVPAFNEEKSILDSINSLLTLKYPEFEVILVNDGSKDRTMETLISGLSLEKVEKNIYGALSSAPIRGVYKTPDIPNLIIVDKENGGKADSLNAAINLAKNDYICTIDADSLLEPESLLRMLYQSLFTDRQTIAFGGNILPANGCTVRNGNLTSISLSKNSLVRFQTIEYLRAFLAGRLGWAVSGCMLIISGAFGVFKRELVERVGGYMTGRGRFKKDTVGEDMELVVRLHRAVRRSKIPYAIPYVFNANCWTEVPEKWGVFSKQRDRWHRGLIEILAHHKSMLFNPLYGRIGLVAVPYFFIFELIGPIFEFIGYIALIISALLGILDPKIALLLFIAIIMYGICISLASLIISENDVLYFSPKETLVIIFYAFLENLGFRQIVSIKRVFSFASFFFNKKGWGKMERTGFAKKAT